MASLTDNFDSYTDGDLNGQGSWSGSTNFDIQGVVTQTGSGKAVFNTTASGTVSVAKTFTSAATGVQSIYGRTADVTVDGTWMTRLDEGAGAMIYIKVSASTLVYFNGATYVSLGSISNDTWFQVECQWDASTDQARYRLNGGTWTAYANFASTITSGLDTVQLFNNSGGTTDCYWDTLADTSGGGASGPANLKSYNTNLLANIKSIDTNLIANVKSLDTNV